MGDASLGVKGVDKRVGDALVLGAAHKRLQLFRLEDGIGASSRFEDTVDLTQQQRLIGIVGQFVDDKVLLGLALLVEPRLDGDGSHIDELEDTGREQIVIVGAEITVGIEHVVGLLEVSLHGDIAIPKQILEGFFTRAPYIDKVPYARDNGDNHKADDHEDKGPEAFVVIIAVAAHIVAAFKGLFFLGLEGVGFLNIGLEETLVEAAHDIHGTTASEGLIVVGHHLTVVETEFATETEAPDAAILLSEANGILFGFNSKVGLIGFGGDISIEEHVTDGIGIGMGMHEVGISIAGDVGTLTAVAKTPAEFITTMLIDDATLACLPAARVVDVPAADILILETCLVGDLQVAHLAAIEDTHTDIALRALRVDAHLTGLGDAGIAITAQHHLDVEPMKLRTCKNSE